jgi:ribosomal protein L7/L12|tara:strand:- start:2327 stop:2620 length:294 start_codon:yes stop_codon:yes gene_type:complete
MAGLAQRSHQLMIKLAAHYEVDVEDLLDSFEGLVVDQVDPIGLGRPLPKERNQLNEHEADLMKHNQKIKAVKSFKNRTGLGLRECVEIMNAWQNANP